MTTVDQPDPRYVTHADLEAFEGRVITRIAELETRLSRDLNSAFWRQLLWLGGAILILGVAVINVGVTILSKLP